MMIINNVQIVSVDNEKYVVFPTMCNIRELYSFKKTEDRFTYVGSAGKKVYFNEDGGAQVLEDVPKLLTSESTATKIVLVPMKKIHTGSASKLLAHENYVEINWVKEKSNL
ncbi:hypothetical protein Zmor_009035 [Zophobas morio]|uniref:Uncharacterized protein n=1 Tax=Zophobas morio TaxID=2755281 RepID=A0AA38HKD2_9CUCU|nr:hypothetical protein Zmor_009035 [Zophobas morio]